MTGMPGVSVLRLLSERPKPTGAVCLALQQAEVRLGITGQVHALRGVDLSIRVGERVALVGSNGCGKSTLLRALHGLVPLCAGTLQQPGSPRIAMLFQRPHLLRLSVLNNIALGLWLQGVPWRHTAGKARAALQRVGMADLAQRNAKALSGGQLQRVALARAWAMQPSVWLLDEPTASLDPQAKHEVEALIADFCSEGSGTRPHGAQPHESTTADPDRRLVPPGPTTLVFTSHNLGQVKRLASRVIYLERGRLLVDLPVHEFFHHERLQAICPSAHFFLQGESL
ncbi:MAG: tungstate transport system ATP-binding protein [Hydrogenophaga sp.]|jgi:tungstate transport system ATP-binding protein